MLCYNYGAFSMRDGALKSGYHKIKFTVQPKDKARYAALMDITSSIPADASVATSEKIGPHLSSRRRFYSLRRGSYHVDYIVVRKKGLRLDRTKKVITEALTSGEYGVFRRVGEFVLLKKGHAMTANDDLIDEWRLKRPRPDLRKSETEQPALLEEEAMPAEPEIDAPEGNGEGAERGRRNGSPRRPTLDESED